MRALVPAFRTFSTFRTFRAFRVFRRRFLSLGAAVAVAGFGLVGSAPHAADAAAPVAKRVVSAHRAQDFVMPAPGVATVQTIRLTAGAWSVIATATAVDESVSDFVRCALTDLRHGTQLDASTAFVGSAGTRAGVLTNVATIVVPAGTTVRVAQQCGHDGAAGDSATIDYGASLVAFQTLDGTAAGQGVARTASSTPLTATGGLSLTLPLDGGTYAVGLKFTAVTFSGAATPTCVLSESGNETAVVPLSIGATTAAASDSYFTFATGFDSVAVDCYAAGAPGAYLDPSTVLWARKVKAVTAVQDGCGARLINGTTDLVALGWEATPCAVNGGNLYPLASASIAKGNWVELGSEPVLISSDGAVGYLRCLLVSGGAELDESRAWDAPSQYFGVATVGAVKLTSPGYASQSCGRDGEATAADGTFGSLVLIRV
jgi:hypothetical protein